jgi:hypothetical protein
VASAICRGNAAGHISDILEAHAKDLAARVSVAQLLVEGGSLLKAEDVELVVFGTCKRTAAA